MPLTLHLFPAIRRAGAALHALAAVLALAALCWAGGAHAGLRERLALATAWPALHGEMAVPAPCPRHAGHATAIWRAATLALAPPMPRARGNAPEPSPDNDLTPVFV